MAVLTAAPGDAPDGPERELLAGLGRIVGTIVAADRSSGDSPVVTSAGLVGAVAEELRGPLAAAASALEGAEGPKSERAREAIRTTTDLLDAVVDVADAGEVEAPVRIDVHELAVRVWPSVRTPGTELALGEPVAVEADPALLERLLTTLLEVALDDAGSDERVTVGSLPEESGFTIETDGQGWPDAVGEALSGGVPSSNGEPRRARLRFARAVVEAHGWTVSVGEGETGRIEVRTGGEGDRRSRPAMALDPDSLNQ